MLERGQTKGNCRCLAINYKAIFGKRLKLIGHNIKQIHLSPNNLGKRYLFMMIVFKHFLQKKLLK